MDTDILLQIIDTSFKVAIGAAIAVFSGWMMLKRNTVIGPRNLREQKRLDIFEDISAFIGNVSHIFSQYAALTGESVEFGASWPAERKKTLEKINTDLLIAFQKISAAEAQLLMLGEKNLERSLKIYTAQIVSYHRQVYVGRKDIRKEQIIALKQRVLQAREQFYDMLSRKYDQVLVGA